MRTGWSGEASDRPHEVALEGGFVVDDLHPPAPQDVRGANEHGISDPFGDLPGLLQRGGGAVRRHRGPDDPAHLLEALPVLGPVDGIHGGAEDLHALGLEPTGQVQRGLPPSWTMTPFGCSRWRISRTSSWVRGSK
jgi:hypothetical protein